MGAKPAATNESHGTRQPGNDEPVARGTHEVLAINEIITDAGTQVRAEINETTVEEYAEHLATGGTFPPITVFRTEESTYLADGFHRLRAHERAGHTDIDAEIRPGTREDALWYALGANGGHGLRLTRPDKKHGVELALKAWPDRSQTRIAKQIGCSHQYVGKVRAQVATSCNLPERTVGEDGKSYPAARETPKAEPREHEDEAEEHATEREAPAPAESVETKEEAGKTEPKGTPSQRARSRSNKIVSVVATDALNLTAQEELIDFRALDQEKLPEWIGELEEARRRLARLIRRLKQEVGSENANDEARIEDPGAAD